MARNYQERPLTEDELEQDVTVTLKVREWLVIMDEVDNLAEIKDENDYDEDPDYQSWSDAMNEAIDKTLNKED